ncbi:MAG: SCO family protein [Chitinophagales bacterium]|nr:SCO family protein [Chitinophagales bacterium]
MINKNKAWAVVMLSLVVILPIISVLVMRQGFKARMNAKPSGLFSESSISIAPYSFISQRGDTISSERMLDKVCVIEFFSNDCYRQRYDGEHPLFVLQEDYKGKTIALRILSIPLDDSVQANKELQEYSSRYAAREMWHVLGGDTTDAKNMFRNCLSFAEKNNMEERNFNCPQFVYLINKQGKICGAYDPADTEQFSGLYTDVLYLIDK